MIEDIKKRRSLISNDGNWFKMSEDLMGSNGYDEPDFIGWVRGDDNMEFVINSMKDIDFLLEENERLKGLL